ncbi:MAG: DUF1232 domain-containing protein [Flavobacteriaceae bacterium]|nr:DUF1232 domain-containing protein [Flavobacteriaceae bacterium]
MQGLFLNRSFILKIPTFFRMLKKTLKREYQLPKTAMIYIALVVLYVLFPLDFIPDWIPFLGWIDDIGILSILISKLTKEIDDFVLWEVSKFQK